MAQTNIACKFDTYVVKGNNNNYDNSATMNIFPGDNIALIQFDVPTIEEIHIKSARLFFYISERGKNMKIKTTLYDVSESLSGITYSKYISNVAGHEILAAEDKYECPSEVDYFFNQWVSSDVTNLVIGNIGKRNYTLSLIGEATNSQMYRTLLKSKEGGFAPYVLLDYDYATPFKPQIEFPNGDSVSNSGNLTFTWKYISGGTTPQKKFDLQWKMQAAVNWNTVTMETPNTYYTMAASLFLNGIVEWRIRTYNNRNMVSEWADSQFIVIGKPGNPVITGVKNDAITEITWSANKSEESAARIKIIKGGLVIYDSGVIPGGINDSHKPNMIFDNGNYSALLSISNMYSMWSDEVSYSFTITNTKPQKPKLEVSAQNDYVHLSFGGSNDSEYFIYRAEPEIDFVPIKRTLKPEFDDYAVKSGVAYRYFVRCYKAAYSDSEIRDVEVRYAGYYISSIGEMEKRIQLFLHDSEGYLPVSKKISNDSARILYVGREKPVKESSRFKSKTIDIEAYVTVKQRKVFEEIYNTNDVFCLRNREEVLYCDIGSVSQSCTFFNLGYLLGLVFEEVDFEAEVRFDE